jgi:hypothetical protein
LEALAQLSDYAAGLAGDCTECFVQGMGAVLTGHDNRMEGHAEVKEVLIQLQKRFVRAGVNADFGVDYNPYYKYIRDNHIELMQSGYDPMFQDPNTNDGGGNQAHHFWFYVQVGYEDGLPDGVIGNVLHETFLTNSANGQSYQDYALGVHGALLGQSLMIGAISPNDVGNFIRQTMALGSNTAYFWANPPTYMP